MLIEHGIIKSDIFLNGIWVVGFTSCCKLLIGWTVTFGWHYGKYPNCSRQFIVCLWFIHIPYKYEQTWFYFMSYLVSYCFLMQISRTQWSWKLKYSCSTMTITFQGKLNSWENGQIVFASASLTQEGQKLNHLALFEGWFPTLLHCHAES